MQTRPVWAEISLDRLARNFQYLRRLLAAQHPEIDVLAVVKANAYGHGVQTCGPALAAAGAHWLGVTSVDEGVVLRRALGVLPSHLSRSRILVMSGLWEGEAEAILDHALTPQVWESYHCELLAEAARRRNFAQASIPVHLEIDTGMARQGVAPGAPLAALLAKCFGAGSPLQLEGVLTHFSAPEVLNGSDNDVQTARFAEALGQLRAARLQPDWLHAGNSATVFDQPHVAGLAALASRYHARLMLRPGLAVYGYPVRFTPTRDSSLPDPLELQPVLAWKTRITSLRDLGPGKGAGYNSTFRATRPTRLALTPVGYADGLNRLLSNRGCMLVRGQRAPIAGRVSMDQTILDVTDIVNAAIGDEVVILGEQESLSGSQSITAWDHADLGATIPYEILCNIAARVPRRVAD